MATNGFSEEDSPPNSPGLDPQHGQDEESDIEETEAAPAPKSALKKTAPPAAPAAKPVLPEQPDPSTLELSKLTPVSPEIISRQATINIGT